MKLLTAKVTATLLLSMPHTALADKAGTLDEFSSVKFEKGALVLVHKPDGAKFMARIGESEDIRTLAGDSRVELPMGKLSFFYVKHHSVSFRPLREGRGFLVRKSYDERESGAGHRAVQFELHIGEGGKLTYGPSQSVPEDGPKAF